MSIYIAHTRQIIKRTFQINEASSLEHARHLYLTDECFMTSQHVEETLSWVIEDPDGKRHDGDDIEDVVDLRSKSDIAREFAIANNLPVFEVSMLEVNDASMQGLPAYDDSNVMMTVGYFPEPDQFPQRINLEGEDLDIMLRLYRDAEAGPARHVFEGRSIAIDNFSRLQKAGFVTIKQMPTGVKLDLTPAGMKFVKGSISAATSPATEALDLLSRPAPKGTPMFFKSYEVRPCIEHDRCVRSFSDMDEFDDAIGVAAASRESFRVFWTLYGMAGNPAPEGTPEPGFHAQAIGDFDSRDQAFAVMNAILAPMAFARDAIMKGCDDAWEYPDTFADAMRLVANDLDDVIGQSSNGERL